MTRDRTQLNWYLESSFTVDTEKNEGDVKEMPTITSLLNRKKLAARKQQAAEQKPDQTRSNLFVMPKDESLVVELGGPRAHKEKARETTPPPFKPPVQEAPVVQPAALKPQASRKASATLVLWDLSVLKASNDPLAQGLSQLFTTSKFSSALFLSITPPPAGSPVPHFVGTAALIPQESRKEKKALWAGVRWDPTLIPEVWNHFVKTGMLELSPPGTMTHISSHRNVLRGALGAKPEEWLTLVRVGPVNACRGVLALVSKQSVLADVLKAFPVLAQSPSQKAKVA